jgi:sugar fermentation stimulation protein A
VFVIQRSDARAFAPNQETDPDFAAALQAAHQAGVEISAFTCHVSLAGIAMGKQVEIVLPLG